MFIGLYPVINFLLEVGVKVGVCVYFVDSFGTCVEFLEKDLCNTQHVYSGLLACMDALCALYREAPYTPREEVRPPPQEEEEEEEDLLLPPLFA